MLDKYRVAVVPVLLIGSLSVAAGCRAKRIRSGIELRLDGSLRLTAEEPMCGCLSVVNATNDAVRLRARDRQGTIGEATLKATERQRFRFDWAGNQNDDFYEIDVFTPDGRRLDARKVLEVEERPRWVECEAASCEFGDLQMKRALAEP